MKKINYILGVIALILIMFFAATDPQAVSAQEPGEQFSQGIYGGMEVERLASRMERFMKMHVEVVRNQMQLNSLLGELIELEIKNAQNGRFTHISDSTYFDTRTAEIFKRPKP